jgi:hypothetical protein
VIVSEPAYPIPRPDGGNDPRFCLGLAIDVLAVLATYRYPLVACSADFTHWQQALFNAIYQEKP